MARGREDQIVPDRLMQELQMTSTIKDLAIPSHPLPLLPTLSAGPPLLGPENQNWVEGGSVQRNVRRRCEKQEYVVDDL